MEHYEEGLVAPESLIILHNCINEALDRTNDELYDWKYLKGLSTYGCMFRLGIRWQRKCCIGPLVHRWVYKEIRLMYDVFQNFIVCSNHALELLSTISSVDKEYVETVISESKHNLDEAKNEVINLRAGYPLLMKEVDEQHCEYYVLR